MWLPSMIFLLFAVSIEMSIGLVPPLKSSSSMGCAPEIFYRTCWTRRLFIGFHNVSTDTSYSARSDGLFRWFRISNVCTCSTSRVIVLVFRFWIIPLLSTSIPFLPLCWLAEFLLGYCVDRYLAIDLIMGGYAVIFPWEYARHRSFLVWSFFDFIRKSIALFRSLPLSFYVCCLTGVSWQYPAQSIGGTTTLNNSVIVAVPFWNLPATAFTVLYLILTSSLK